MMLIVAIIKSFNLDEMQDPLRRAGVAGPTVAETKGCGRCRAHTEIYRGAEYTGNFLSKPRFEIAAARERAHEAAKASIGAAPERQKSETARSSSSPWNTPCASAPRDRRDGAVRPRRADAAWQAGIPTK
jgi:nitrogen regulatory protein PII